MPVEIDAEYRRRVHGFVRRNMQRREPIKGAFNMLAKWRNFSTLMTMEDNRDFALERVRVEQSGHKDVSPVVVRGDSNVISLSLVRR